MMTARSKAKLLSLVIRSSSNDELELIIRRVESELKRRGVNGRKFATGETRMTDENAWNIGSGGTLQKSYQEKNR